MTIVNSEVKKDWRIGISWDVLIIGFYVLLSLFELMSSPSSFNVVNGLLILGLAYYVYATYKVKHNEEKGVNVQKTMIFGIVMFSIFAFFSVANLFMMLSGQLGADASYLNVLLLVALGKSCFAMKKLKGQQ